MGRVLFAGSNVMVRPEPFESRRCCAQGRVLVQWARIATVSLSLPTGWVGPIIHSLHKAHKMDDDGIGWSRLFFGPHVLISDVLMNSDCALCMAACKRNVTAGFQFVVCRHNVAICLLETAKPDLKL